MLICEWVEIGYYLKYVVFVLSCVDVWIILECMEDGFDCCVVVKDVLIILFYDFLLCVYWYVFSVY